MSQVNLTKMFLISFYCLSILLSFAQGQMNETEPPKAYSADGFHVEGNFEAGLGVSGFSIEPKYAFEDNYEVGLVLTTKRTYQVFNNNQDFFDDGSVKGIMLSMRTRNMEKIVAPYLGLKMGVFFVEEGAEIIQGVPEPSIKSSGIGYGLNFGIYLGPLNLGIYTERADTYYRSTGFNLGLRI